MGTLQWFVGELLLKAILNKSKYMFDQDQFIILIAMLRDRAYEFITAELKRLGLKGAPSHGAIIVALLEHKQLSLKQLSVIIDKKKSSTTELVDKLIALGYVKKSADPQDQRIKLVALTDKSWALKKQFAEFTDNLTEKTFKGISQEERQEVIRIITKILKNFNQ